MRAIRTVTQSPTASLRLALAVALFLSLSLIVAACGGDDDAEEVGAEEPGEYVFAGQTPTEPVDDVYSFSEEETSGEEFATDPPWDVHFAQYASDLPILAFFLQELEEYAEDYPNINLTSSDGELDPTKFVADIESAVARDVDALIVEPADAHTAVPAVEAAVDAGIPVIAMQAEVASPSVATTIVASDLEAGEQQAEAMIEELRRRNDGEARGNIIIVNGLTGHQLTDEQNETFKATLDEHPDIKIVCDQDAEFQPSQAVQVLENCLQANPNADAAWYIGADIGGPLAQTAMRLGRDGDDFFFVGGGGNSETLGLMKREEGLITYDYVYPGGALPTLEATQRLLMGESVPGVILIASPGSTPETVDEFLAVDTPYFGWPQELPAPWQ